MATKADTSGALKRWKQRESTLACNTFYRGKIVFVSNNIAFNQIRMKLVRNACCTFIMMKKNLPLTLYNTNNCCILFRDKTKYLNLAAVKYGK